jgi:streptogramin lyase
MLRTVRRTAIAMFVSVGAAAVLAAGAQATTIQEFPVTVHPGSDPLGITGGPDGNLWFTDGGTTHAIGRITPSGTITEFTSGLTHGVPNDITSGPDGNMWFTETGASSNAVGKITPAGAITEFTTGLNSGSAPSNITVGPDGNMWFLDDGPTRAIGRITTAGVITEVNAPTPNSNLEDLTVGADGNMWYTNRGDHPGIGRVTPGVVPTVMEFHGTLASPNNMPNGITAAADGNLWFTDEGSPGALGKVTPAGTISPEFTSGLQPNAVPDAITAGPDGNVWFEDNLGGKEAVGRIAPNGTITEFKNGLSTLVQDDITVGADGNLWIEQASPDGTLPGAIARITPAGVIAEFTQGLRTGAGKDGDQLITGPDGNLWFNDRGAKAIGKVSLQIAPKATTGAASAVTNSTAKLAGSVNPLGTATTVTFQYGSTPALGKTVSAGTLAASGDASTVTASLAGLTPGTVVYYRVVAANSFGTSNGSVLTFKTTGSPPPVKTVTNATFANQRITLTTPSLQACTSKTGRLSVRLTSTTIAHSHAAKLRFRSASFFLDKGVRHTRKVTRHLRNGHKKRVIVVFFKANASTHHLPATLAIRVTGLRSGTHTLKVLLTYSERVTKHRHRLTVNVTRPLRVKFTIC